MEIDPVTLRWIVVCVAIPVTIAVLRDVPQRLHTRWGTYDSGSGDVGQASTNDADERPGEAGAERSE